MKNYYKGLIKDVKNNYNVSPNSSLEELIATFEYYLEENEKLEKQLKNKDDIIETVIKILENNWVE